MNKVNLVNTTADKILVVKISYYLKNRFVLQYKNKRINSY
jgi:hypothetical protein